jgi:hypothetical protein
MEGPGFQEIMNSYLTQSDALNFFAVQNDTDSFCVSGSY